MKREKISNHSRRFSSWRTFATALVFLGCTTTPEPVPVSSGVPQSLGGVGFNNNDNVQSETALGVLSPGVVVAFYNDFSVSNENPLFDPVTSTWKRGWSILGWSSSSDAGQTWDYLGQVHPPTGWAAIGADPSVVVDASGTIFAVSLAVSDAAWSTISSDNETTTVYPLNVSDSFCVAISTDGGNTFPTVDCKVVSDITNNHEVDRTAITKDGADRVWVSVEDVPGGQADFGRPIGVYG